MNIQSTNEVKRAVINEIKPIIVSILQAQLGLYIDPEDPKLELIATSLIGHSISQLIPKIETTIEQEVRTKIRRMI